MTDTRRFSKLESLVLNVKPYRETSALVQFFSRREGRLTVVMRGVRRGRQRNPIQAFQSGYLSCYGRGELMTGTGFEAVHTCELKGDALNCGFYVLEVLTRVLAVEQAEPEIYEITEQTLERLSLQKALAITLRRFERGLLENLGYGINFLEDATGQPLDPEGYYIFDPQSGFVRASGEDRDAVEGAVLHTLAQGADEAVPMRVVRSIFQARLEPLLGPRPLVSRSLLQAKELQTKEPGT